MPRDDDIKIVEEINSNSGMCSACGENPADEPHPCPYAEELNGDETECDCCEECAAICADDI